MIGNDSAPFPLPPPLKKLEQMGKIRDIIKPPSEIDIKYREEIEKKQKNLNKILSKVNISGPIDYSKPPPPQIYVLLFTFETCITLHETGIIKLRQSYCVDIIKIFLSIIENLTNEYVHEDWIFSSNGYKAPFRIILEAVKEISIIISDYRKPIDLIKKLLIIKTIDAYEVLENKLDEYDKQLGKEIIANYECYSEYTYDFDERGNIYTADDYPKDENEPPIPVVTIETEKEKSSKPNPFAVGKICLTCENKLDDCEQTLDRLYKGRSKPNIVEPERELSCEEKLEICRNKVNEIRALRLKMIREVTQEEPNKIGGRKTRRKKTKRTKKRKTRGKYNMMKLSK